jgi:hypothetical protein
MAAKGVFVDDEDKEFAALMSTAGELVFEHQTVIPITDQAIAVWAVDPTVVALDYRLDEVTPDIDAAHSYKGSALAQHLRDNAITEPDRDFAIILVSNEMKLKTLYAPDKTAHDLFDLVYSKEDVTKYRSRVKTECLSLSRGYEFLRSLKLNYDPVAILAATEGERERLSGQEMITAFSNAAAPHIVAKFVLRNIIERAGPLIDDADTAALLGIDEASFEKVAGALQDYDLAYRGLFSGGWRRWWTHRIEAWGAERLGGNLLSLTAAERAAALSGSLDLSLQPAPSPWDGSIDEYISFACVSCRRPAELRHSLAAFDPRAPRFATRPRICWDCIQTDQFQEANLQVDEVDHDLVDEVKSRQRKA